MGVCDFVLMRFSLVLGCSILLCKDGLLVYFDDFADFSIVLGLVATLLPLI
jgi:hypothetical protein